MKLLARLRRSDDGAMLIFALIIITTVALVSGAVLAHGGANFSATVTLRNVAGQAYAADAAAKMAINDLELGENAPDPEASYPTNTPNGWVFDGNVDGTGCFGKNSDGTPRTAVNLPSVYSAQMSGPTTATVTCSPVPGTGIFGTAPGGNDNGTGRAITVLGSTGLVVNPLSSGNAAQQHVTLREQRQNQLG